jgi:outer membrane biosynthesis protein TonB
VEHAPSGSFTVWIETVIDRNGDVRLARVKQVGTRPIPMLEEGALACVRRRRYHPASFEGHPFGFRLTVPVTYKFE